MKARARAPSAKKWSGRTRPAAALELHQKISKPKNKMRASILLFCALVAPAAAGTDAKVCGSAIARRATEQALITFSRLSLALPGLGRASSFSR